MMTIRKMPLKQAKGLKSDIFKEVQKPKTNITLASVLAFSQIGCNSIRLHLRLMMSVSSEPSLTAKER